MVLSLGALRMMLLDIQSIEARSHGSFYSPRSVGPGPANPVAHALEALDGTIQSAEVRANEPVQGWRSKSASLPKCSMRWFSGVVCTLLKNHEESMYHESRFSICTRGVVSRISDLVPDTSGRHPRQSDIPVPCCCC